MLIRVFIVLILVGSEVSRQALFGVGDEPALSTKVTFDYLAMPAGRLIPLLSEESGIPLLCSNAVARDVLLLTCRDAPLKEVMDRIAYVAGAEWVKFDGGFRLTRDLALARTQEREDTL